MKLARLFLAAITAATLGACSDSVTAPEARPDTAAPAKDGDFVCTGVVSLQTMRDGTVVVLCNGSPTIGSGG
ncbi:hypothetical protein [Longimicrobium terrae]|uniref:Secreted protein n=1 Tax=Longimicrobium terrae TaxID=1639882 RepID=A0A841H227_9BACT|nr:hypothetical protein [Longimicrobium terrae]MBB4637663.1 hypothetical protein [Longimicrobium terrae]MBB6072060.1 hypothetical protein [Longimicrobium terrae]NNC29856.1 hypothetical protein [Longimicrobium terrae]